MKETTRASGVLMHISSLPGQYGIGTLGKNAEDFLKFLKRSFQSYWQVLPIGPTGYGDSPYQSFSAFAGNPYFIDLDCLKDMGYLKDEELLSSTYISNLERVDYGKIYNERYKTLNKAFERFDKCDRNFKDFKEENFFWLEDYAIFMAIKMKNNGRSWIFWEDDLKFKRKSAVEKFEDENFELTEFFKFLQYIFFRQWRLLKLHANNSGIKLIGDLPLYVSFDSSDVWSNPSLFKLDENLNPKFVAGVPPDRFSNDGQLWGNPVYDWSFHRETNYKWWIERINMNFKNFDTVRLDHFRGFESYWEIPYGEDTARNGKWVKGPGIQFFEKIKKECGDLDFIAEDLGFLTKESRELKEKTGYPGMKVMLFAFDGNPDNEYLPHNCEENSIMYIGTHDNSTVSGWAKKASVEELECAKKYLNQGREETLLHAIMRNAMMSRSKTAIFQMQDLLMLDDSSRMNTPGTSLGNWSWRMKKTDYNEEMEKRLKDLTVQSCRNNLYQFED